MKAVIFNKKHRPSKVQYTEIEKPTVGEDQVLIQVKCGSINAADYRSIQMGLLKKNKVIGSAISGIVDSVGSNVNRFKVGDEVLGDLADFGFGGFAEYACVPQDALSLKPASISFEDAVSLPVAATTALKALRDKGDIQIGHKVLIVGAAGGVGSYAIQLAKHFGAEVTAVCSGKNIDHVKALGADYTLDYTKEDFTQTEERYDLILAVNGSYSLLSYKKLLKNSGKYVMIGGTMVQILKSLFFGWMLSFGSKKMLTLSAKSDAKDLEFVADLMAKNKLKSFIEKRYSLEQTGEAMSYASKGHVKGKLVISVDPS